MKIITLTLNPAFDLHCSTAHFASESENLATVTRREAGGKGVNISRALKAGGVESMALLVLGQDNAAAFEKALAADGLFFEALYRPGSIRENITIHPENAPETRLSFTGFSADDGLLLQVESALAPLLEPGCIVTLTGRLPEGVGMPAVQLLLARLRRQGVHIVVDSRSFSLSDLTAARPFLIKPNQEEISAYLGYSINSFEAVCDAAQKLCCRGIEHVMVSLGAQGALLCCRQGCYTATAPKIRAVSTIGAGDSSIAGFLAAFVRGDGAADCLRTAVAYGSAACLTPGTLPPRSQDLQELIPKVTVRSL